MLSCNVLIAHSVGDLEGEIRIFVEAEPGFRLAFRIVPDGGIFFGVFSHGLQLAEVGGYGLVLYDIYLSQPVYYRAVRRVLSWSKRRMRLPSGVMPTMLKVMLLPMAGRLSTLRRWRGKAGGAFSGNAGCRLPGHGRFQAVRTDYGHLPWSASRSTFLPVALVRNGCWG